MKNRWEIVVAVKSVLGWLLRDTRGVALVLIALTLSALIGFTGLGVETGLWYAIQRQNQSAADMAAISGAFELVAGQANGLSPSEIYPGICAFARRDATRNGFVATGSCPLTSPTSASSCTSLSSGQMCVNNPPLFGSFAGINSAVEVVLSQQQTAYLASLFLPNVTINTRAVAVVQTVDRSCILALAKTVPGVWLQGSASICLAPTPGGVCTPPGDCSIAANSNSSNAVNLVGNPTIVADTIVTPGAISGSTANVTLATPAVTGAPPVADPYAGALTHSALTAGLSPALSACLPPTLTVTGKIKTDTYPGSCQVSDTTIKSDKSDIIVLSANTQIAGGLDIKGVTVNLSPGTYWITDGDLTVDAGGILECTACNVASGAGVTIILTTDPSSATHMVGGISMKGSASITSLNAPGAGVFSGVLLVQDPDGPFTSPSNPSHCKNVLPPCSAFFGDPGSTFNGLVYFPGTSMEFQGNASVGAKSCLLLVVNQLELAGNPSIADSGCASAGLGTVPTVKTVALKE